MDADRAVEKEQQKAATLKAVAEALMSVRKQPKNQQYDFKWLFQPLPHGETGGFTRG